MKSRSAESAACRGAGGPVLFVRPIYFAPSALDYLVVAAPGPLGRAITFRAFSAQTQLHANHLNPESSMLLPVLVGCCLFLEQQRSMNSHTKQDEKNLALCGGFDDRFDPTTGRTVEPFQRRID
jgi:hypothetical protein